MARPNLRKGWTAAGIGLGACALAGASWVYADQQTVPAPAPSTTAAPAVQPAAPHAVAKTAAPPSTGASPWNKLTRAQQAALQPLAGEWNKLDAPRRQKWLDIANRYASMKPDEQARVQDRMREWIKLTPEQRRTVRENYTRAKKIDPGQKSAQWEQYQQLPEEQKKKLAAEAVPKKVPVVKTPAAAVAPAAAPPATPVTTAPVTPAATPAPMPDHAK